MTGLRSATPDDADALTRLALVSKAHWGYDADFMAACVEELTITPTRIRSNPTAVVEIDGQIAGFAMLTGAGAERELEYVYVSPDFLGRGLGAVLVQWALDEARAAGARHVIVQSDPNAEGFYRCQGGQPAGARPSDSIAGRMLPLLRFDLDPPPDQPADTD